MLRVSAMPLLALVLLCPVVAMGSEYHVATLGDDHAEGSIRAPWRTLEGARDNLRRLRQDGQLQGHVTVFVHGGTYTLTAPLTLQREDSGTADAPMTYRSWQDERVVLTGGREVTSLAPFRSEILQADVSELHIPGSCRVLLWGGQRQEVARYPNRDPRDINGGEWTHVDGQRVNMYQDMPGYESYHAQHQHLDYWQRNVPELTRTLRMQDGDVRDWAHPEDGEVSVFPRFNWRHYLLPIDALEREQGLLRLDEGSFYEIRAGDRYFVRNLWEELDAPGEWFLDSRTATLYFWPPQPLSDRPVSLAVAESLMRLEQCEHVIVHGFELECCLGDAVVLRDCRHCRLSKSIIRGVGDNHGSGVCVVGGTANEVIGNDISFCGAHGISLSGGDVVRLELGGNVAENNYIDHVGQVGRFGKGIEVIGAGQRIAHNLIHDTPHSGIFMWGCHHVVEYDHLRHTCLESEDVGAIGSGAIDWLSWQATAIRYNFIHDTIGFGFDVESDRWRSPYFAWALYPDWAASGVQIVGNVLVRAPSGLIYVRSGRDASTLSRLARMRGDFTCLHRSHATSDELQSGFPLWRASSGAV